MTGLLTSAPQDLADVIHHIESPALVLGDDRRIAASNAAARRLARSPVEDIAGSRCYQALDVTDMLAGTPCVSTCPLGPGRQRSGWSHSRVVEVSDPYLAGSANVGRRDCLVVRCVTTGGERANLCFLGRPLAERSEHLARLVGVFETLRDAPPEARNPRHLGRLCLEAAMSAAGGETGEVFAPEAMGEPLEVGEPGVVGRPWEPGEGRPEKSARDLRRSFFGGRLPDQFLRDGLPLLVPVPRRVDGGGGVRGIYLCAPVVSERVVIGSVGIYGALGDIDVVTALRALSVVTAFLGDRIGGMRSPRSTVGTYARQDDADPARRYERARLRIHVLGPLKLEVDGERPSGPTWKKRRRE